MGISVYKYIYIHIYISFFIFLFWWRDPKSQYKDRLSQVWGFPILKIRRSLDHLIFNMGIPILVRWHLYIETGPRSILVQIMVFHMPGKMPGNDLQNDDRVTVQWFQYWPPGWHGPFDHMDVALNVSVPSINSLSPGTNGCKLKDFIWVFLEIPDIFCDMFSIMIYHHWF